jgi:hypothetical protein
MIATPSMTLIIPAIVVTLVVTATPVVAIASVAGHEGYLSAWGRTLCICPSISALPDYRRLEFVKLTNVFSHISMLYVYSECIKNRLVEKLFR